ncbi:hypothetical protein RIF29_31149 [Crotalaria pallida]|uniref:Uncharacterized protein n=1 Tax=Crotalaria pallida TaxID=3830 RepID=A0AAN9EHG0_CROPI
MSNLVSSLPVSSLDARRSANFHPTIWGDHFLSYSSTSKEEGGSDLEQFQKLKEEVRKMLVSPIENSFSLKLNFIDSVQRLGVSYHFESEIDEALYQIYDISTNNNIIMHDHNLHHLALLFRLLRQQGYCISSSVFYKFKDETRNFNEKLVNDVQGLLSLYEASQLRIHGEEILDEAHNFAHTQLKKSLMTTQMSPSLAAQVHHSLGQTLRRGMPRLEARFYISLYQKDPSHDENLLTFAKLDFNMLQKLHQKEVSSMTKWWHEDLNVSTNYPFARDRIVEACFWILGVYFEPQYSLARRIMMKVLALSSIIDDMYDAYGTIEELELFTIAIERWDISCLDDLPGYMKICYVALLDVYEEIEQDMRKEGKAYCINYAKEQMKRLVGAYITEARWFHGNYIPTMEEYLGVATVSCGFFMLTTTSFLGMEDTTEDILKWATRDPKIVADASIICRLMDDIAGGEFEQKRGHVASIVECCMKQQNISRQNAIDELRKVVESAWKYMNEECLNPTQVPKHFLMRTFNLARMMDVLYKDQDNYTNSGGIMKDYIEALLLNNIPT